MSAPRIKIFFANGALGLAVASTDGVIGLLCTGVAVSSTFTLATPYTLFSLDSLTALGVTSINNPGLYKIVSDFYAEAGNGAELWLMAFPDTVKLSDMVDPTVTTKAKALMNASNGRISGFIVSRTPAGGYTPTITNGLDADVALAVSNAELFAAWCEDPKASPIFVVIEGYGYGGVPTALTDLTTGNSNHTTIMIGATTPVVSGATAVPASIGLAAGRLARNPIQNNIAQVKDGPVKTVTAYIADKAVESADWESLHNKGYLTFRTFPGRSGYFFNDDPTATLPTDDYCHLTARRTINKAFRIAYQTLLEKLISAVPVTAAGTLQLAIAKSWQTDVERAVAASMTANGELSADVTDPNDKGVKCLIDALQNLVASGQIAVELRVRPFGYPRYIPVKLGFQVVS